MRKTIIERIMGVNWKTTMAAIAAIVAVVGRIYAKWKSKDFSAIFEDGQELMSDIGLLVAAVGLLQAKDKDVHGAGDSAVRVE